MEFVISSSLLKKFMESLAAVEDEALLTIVERGLVGKCVDQSNSALVTSALMSDVIDLTGEDGEEICIDSSTLHNILKSAPSNLDVYWSNDAETIILNIGQHRHTIPMRAMSAMRRIPRVPELVFTAMVDLSGVSIKDALKMASSVGEVVNIRASPDDFMMTAYETGREFEFLVPATEIPGHKLPKDSTIEASYNICYLELLKSLYGSADLVRIAWEDQKPLKMTFDVEPGLRVIFLLAPRMVLS